MMPNGRKIYQHFPFQGPPKYTQIGILVLKYTIWQPCFCYKCLNWIGRRMNNRFLWRFNSPQFPFSKQKTSNLNLYVHKAFRLLCTYLGNVLLWQSFILNFLGGNVAFNSRIFYCKKNRLCMYIHSRQVILNRKTIFYMTCTRPYPPISSKLLQCLQILPSFFCYILDFTDKGN
jgi:hypothetical protein